MSGLGTLKLPILYTYTYNFQIIKGRKQQAKWTDRNPLMKIIACIIAYILFEYLK